MGVEGGMGGDPKRCAAFKAAMEILGKPWSGVLLRELYGGELRFSELSERLSVGGSGGEARGIGDRMLSLRLKELEAAGLVVRRVEPGPPVRVGYALTELGAGLGEVAAALEAWGARLLEARGGAGGEVEVEVAGGCGEGACGLPGWGEE